MMDDAKPLTAESSTSQSTTVEVAKPLIAESSTSESTTVEVVLNGIRDGDVRIPDYQRDSDQWDDETKSLLIESVINNLSVPAFFFEVIFEGGVERDGVIDGQQRLTTLDKFYKGDFALVDSDEATHPSAPPALMTFDEMRDSFFPHFERWINRLVGQKGVSLPVTKHRIVAAVIGAAYRGRVDPNKLSEQQWTNIVEFIRKPAEIAKTFSCEWPMSKGRWDGPKGYAAQMNAAQTIITKLTE